MPLVRPTLVALLGVSLFVFPSTDSVADGGYFQKGEAKKLTISQPGFRSSDEKIALLSIFGGALLVGGIGTFYALDARSLSDQISANEHTDQAWSQTLSGIQTDAERSVTIARVTYGISGALFLAGIVTYIITEPDETTSYTELQSQLESLPTLSLASNGTVFAQKSWSY